MFFFFKQKTAYELRISDWSSDVCSSDLPAAAHAGRIPGTTRRKYGPQALRRRAISRGEQTTPSRPPACARCPRRSTCASSGPSSPPSLRSPASARKSVVQGKMEYTRGIYGRPPLLNQQPTLIYTQLLTL